MDNYHQYFDLGELISKYIKNELTEQQKTELDHWLKQGKHNRELFSKLTNDAVISEHLAILSASGKEKAWGKIVKSTGFKNTNSKTVRARRWFPYAAATFLLLTIGITVSKYINKKGHTKLFGIHQTDILPGSYKAILTLADGSKIILDDAKRGKIARQQNVEIEKTQAGQVVYKVERSGQFIGTNTVIINALATPRGGQYEIVLPDGTKAWLNAASSLKYPTAFFGTERQVELTGEAYFEVTKNRAKPFFVKTAGQTVEVLGTHFNINSYADEKATRTTLLEGSVKVAGNASSRIVKLRPGQQAMENGKEIKVVSDPDIDETMAWKNGKFLFRDTDLPSIMRMISRWYDVDVEYQGPAAGRHYRGRISRNVPVSQVFEILKTSGVNFSISGRKIIVKS